MTAIHRFHNYACSNKGLLGSSGELVGTQVTPILWWREQDIPSILLLYISAGQSTRACSVPLQLTLMRTVGRPRFTKVVPRLIPRKMVTPNCRPTWRQTTSASKESQPILQIFPHDPLLHKPTFPSSGELPWNSLISSSFAHDSGTESVLSSGTTC
jgi:hypothetical protein